MEFSHYAPCPKNVSEEVIAAAKKREEERRTGKYVGRRAFVGPFSNFEELSPENSRHLCR